MNSTHSKNKEIAKLLTSELQRKGIAQKILEKKYLRMHQTEGDFELFEVQFNIKGIHYIISIHKETAILEKRLFNGFFNKEREGGDFSLKEKDEIESFLLLFSRWIERALFQNVFLPDCLPNTENAKRYFGYFCTGTIGISPNSNAIERFFQELQERTGVDKDEFDLLLYDFSTKGRGKGRFEISLGSQGTMLGVFNEVDGTFHIIGGC